MSSKGYIRQLVATTWWLWMFALHPIKVSIENRRVALPSEENERISQWFEESLNRSGNCLTGLGIVIHDDGLIHGEQLHSLTIERFVRHLPLRYTAPLQSKILQRPFSNRLLR